MNQLQPHDYGLPYEDWWIGQKEAIDDTIKALDEPDTDCVMLLADTGTGKTGIATAVSKSFSNSSVLAPTISLEQQYGQLTGLEIGRGRRWHKCDFSRPGTDALQCYSSGMCSGRCEYKRHIETIKNQKMRILNYAQFYALNQRQSGFRSELVVCDEGHGVEGTLQGFAELWYGEETPTWGSEYKNLLFDYGKKFLFMSAHMIPQLVAETLDIDKYTVIEADNNFPAANNPVFVKPVGYVTSRTPRVDRLVRFIDRQLEGTTYNGVIHTSSDRQTQAILSESQYQDRLFWPRGQNRASTIQWFKQRPNEGIALISPSLYEGQDFPYDECRWQIVCKVPYADLGSAHVAARRKERPDIYRLEALQKVHQACGRGMRAPDDWCVNYILDASVIDLYSKFGHMLSKRFQESWRGVQ